MTRVMPSDATSRDSLQFIMLRCRVDYDRREKLFQLVAVVLEQQAEELSRVIAHDVRLQSLNHPRVLERFIASVQANDPFERNHMCGAQVEI